jgi:hypothetical protein
MIDGWKVKASPYFIMTTFIYQIPQQFRVRGRGSVLWIHPYKLSSQTNNKIKSVLWVSYWNCLLISRWSALQVEHGSRSHSTVLHQRNQTATDWISVWAMRIEVYFHRLQTLFDCNLLPTRIIMHYLGGSDTAGSPTGIVPTWQKQNPPFQVLSH